MSKNLLTMNRETLRAEAFDRKAAFAVSSVVSNVVVVVRRPILGGEGKL